MNRANLIPDKAEVELVCLRQRAGSIEVELRACQTFSVCPSCAGRSSRVHSRYRRRVADLPWEGVPVEILLRARKFFCDQERCSRRIFTEKLPGTVERYSRRSRRSSEALIAITMSLGGRAGARLARKLGLLASGPTLLRVLRMQSRPSISSAPRVVGIDEWAWKKGHRYGTILCDLEQGRVIDLLPNRSTETVAAWLRRHPSVEVVSRDGASAFADAIATGAPKAVQVADRWHLLNNLLETLMRSLERHRHTMSEVAMQMICKSHATSIAEDQCAAPTVAAERTLLKREHRLKVYQDILGLLDAGTSQSEASRQLGVSLRTVQRWLSYGVFPERKRRVFPSIVDAYGPHLEKRYGEGCRNIMLLWEELKERGFEGKSLTVRRWLRHRFGSTKKNRAGPVTKRLKPIGHQRIGWLMLKADPLKHRYLKALYDVSPE